jgi:Kef-type K+ transport system membrane component KefB
MVAERLHLPQHVGELVFGILLGPSLLGWVWPAALAAIFPPDVISRSLLDVTSWIGVIFLAIIAGMEIRLGVLRKAGAAIGGAWMGGFGLPFVCGFVLGLEFPASLVPAGIERAVFALFVATAMSISAIPVIARILMDLDLYKTRVGMIVLSSAIADDTIGWIVLAVVAGLASGGLNAGSILRTISLTGLFVAAAATVGTPFVRAALRFSRRVRLPAAELSMIVLLVFGAAAFTQTIGVHLVLGAFVAAILIGRDTSIERSSVEAIRGIGQGLFVPFFFAYIGIKVDLTTLRGATLLFALCAVVVACVSKIIGGGVGAKLGGLPKWEAISVGLGLNARGAMELVIAAIGLSIGVLTQATYAAIVLVAVFTTVMTAPLLRWSCAKAGLFVDSQANSQVP